MGRVGEIIGAPYDQAAGRPGAAAAPARVRQAYLGKWLPRLSRHWGVAVTDGGDVIPPVQSASQSTVLDGLADYSGLVYGRVV